jgi:hypothetical protein
MGSYCKKKHRTDWRIGSKSGKALPHKKSKESRLLQVYQLTNTRHCSIMSKRKGKGSAKTKRNLKYALKLHSS